MNNWLFLIPVISAIIGWVINSMAIQLLFRPRKPMKIFGVTFQGIFPKRQQQFAEKLGKLASTEFFSVGDMEQKISNPENLRKVMPLIETNVDDFLRNRLKEEMPVIGMFIGDKTITNLKGMFMKEIETFFPLVMKQYATNLTAEVNLEQIVSKKIAKFSTDKLEKLLHHSLSGELRQFRIMGAVVGFIIGVVQILISLLII